MKKLILLSSFALVIFVFSCQKESQINPELQIDPIADLTLEEVIAPYIDQYEYCGQYDYFNATINGKRLMYFYNTFDFSENGRCTFVLPTSTSDQNGTLYRNLPVFEKLEDFFGIVPLKDCDGLVETFSQFKMAFNTNGLSGLEPGSYDSWFLGEEQPGIMIYLGFSFDYLDRMTGAYYRLDSSQPYTIELTYVEKLSDNESRVCGYFGGTFKADSEQLIYPKIMAAGEFSYVLSQSEGPH